MTAEVDPADISRRLVETKPPAIKLPWITYEDADKHNMLGAYADMSLADLSSVRHLVVYFYSTEGLDDPYADTMCNAFRDHDEALSRMGVLSVGISTQTPLEQLEMAEANLLPPYQLSDPTLLMADALKLPVKEIDGRDQYEALTLTIVDGRIAQVFFPIVSPKSAVRGVVESISHVLTNWELPTQPTQHDAANGK